VNANGGTAPYNYSWNTNPPQYNATAANITSGNYTVTITDANGCATVSTVAITQPAVMSLSFSTGDTVCPGQSFIVSANAGGGTGPYTYNWNNNLGNTSSHTVYPVSPTTYTVNATDANGCVSPSGSISVDVYLFTVSDLVMTPVSPLCEGTSATIGATVSGNPGTLTWVWSNPSWTNGGPFTVQPNQTTTYQVTVTNQCGVSVSGNSTVIVHPLPAISLAPQTSSGCDRVPFTFADNDPNNAGDTYYWNFGDNFTGTGSSITHNYLSSGTYNVNVIATSPFGCVGNGSTLANVTVFDSPVADFAVASNVMSELEPTFQFENQCSINTIGWQWDFGDNTTDNVPSPSHTYAQRGTYTARLIATSNGGCTDTTEMPVTVAPEYTLYVPNAFTPNGDGKNDVFFAYGNEINEFYMAIFDRWGNQIFSSDNISNGWDGRAADGEEIAQQDVYVYKIAVKDFQGKSHRITGSFSLLK
jgi:gliding motility-associated-like protein